MRSYSLWVNRIALVLSFAATGACATGTDWNETYSQGIAGKANDAGKASTDAGKGGSGGSSGTGGAGTGGSSNGGSAGSGGKSGTGAAGTGGAPDAGTTDSSTKEDGSTGSSTDSGAAGSGGSIDAGAAGSGGTNNTGCVAITVGEFKRNPKSSDTGAQLYAVVSPGIGGADPDGFYIEVYESGGYTQSPGTFDLSQSPDNNYATCDHCVRIAQDVVSGIASKHFYQSAGKLTLDVSGSPITGFIRGALTDVTLVEVEIDPDTYVTTPVSGGACYTLSSASFDLSGWNTSLCPASYYNDGEYCDCECGAWDPDCDDDTLLVDGCDWGQSCTKPSGTCQ